MNNITLPNKKNVIEPVTVLLRNLLLPNFFPNIAANESAIVKINAAGIAVFLSKSMKINVNDTNKYVAPVVLFTFSFSRNNSLKKNIKCC